MKQVIFLTSGNGGNIRFLFHAIKILHLPLEITHVIADRECGGLEFARRIKLHTAKIEYKQSQPAMLNQLLSAASSSYVITNIHKVLDTSTLSQSHTFVNLHYSLLPAFRGLIGMKTVDEAKNINSRFIGATCHSVTDDLDGGPILQQGIFRVDWNMPVDQIYDTVFQTGAFTLLNVLIGKPKAGAVQEIRLPHYNVMFSDVLTFDWQKLIVQNIWQIISDDTL